MSIEHIETIELPTYALCYLFNNDSSGMEDEDIEAVDQWTNNYRHHTNLTFNVLESEGSFNHNPEFGLPCDTVSCEVWGEPTEAF